MTTFAPFDAADYLDDEETIEAGLKDDSAVHLTLRDKQLVVVRSGC